MKLYPSWTALPATIKSGWTRKMKNSLRSAMPKGIFCYKVMPFGLKNAGATYQRAMQNIFDDFLHKRVECYVDDLVVKTKQRSDHLLDLRAVFERLRRFQLKMNPLKCAFGVTSGKFLGFIVHHRGIEIDQSKIDAIQKMPAPRNVSELKSFQGHLAYIRRFISNLAGRCQPFSRLLKKETPFEWDESCQNAFNNIKAYLTKPPVLVAPTVGRPLLLYIAAQEGSVGTLLAQCGDDNKERSLYYLSRTHNGACLRLFKSSVTILRHIRRKLISRADQLKYIMSRPILSGRLAKWALLLSEFEINFVPQRAIKGQALANFLADHPVPAEWELTEEFPDEEIFLVEVLPPVDLRERVQIRRAAPKYVFIHDILYRRSYEGLLLRCLSKEEGLQVLKETPQWDLWGTPSRPKLHLQTKRLGYYWAVDAFGDAIEMARTCKAITSSMPITYTKRRNHFTRPSHHGHSRLGDGYHWSHLS
ncbi:hypothetical protein H6P81_012184 [Aristolochia fimbriata]|uniref:Reverse transcriptase domain-containing protein n=1 Tax=Aristolochia fimbriata TaxID=158543 RepID=A0AAV7EE63_ARIFI|nr:hypothetical protein H6P81_012184 [Aristolochia fimbriata]